MRKYFTIAMVCVVITVFLIRVVPLIRKNVRCDTYDKFVLGLIDGVVEQKYIDSSQHGYKTVELRSLKDSALEKMFFDFDLTELYDSINVTDTLYKGANSDSVFRLTNGQRILISKADFGCKR